VLKVEPHISTGVWGDVRENGKDEFVWEFENCNMRCDEIEGWSIELMRELVQWQVWGPGGPRNSDSGTIAGRCFVPRPFASLEKNVEVFTR
jgi:hypothetical protein